MDIETYFQNALRTEAPIDNVCKALGIEPESVPEHGKQKMRMLHALLGLVSEVGEITDQFKKHFFYGKPLDLVNLQEELGDTDWYHPVMIDAVNTLLALGWDDQQAANIDGDASHIKTWSQILQQNFDKLYARYGEKFTEYAAEHRDLATERQILEGTPEKATIVNEIPLGAPKTCVLGADLLEIVYLAYFYHDEVAGIKGPMPRHQADMVAWGLDLGNDAFQTLITPLYPAARQFLQDNGYDPEDEDDDRITLELSEDPREPLDNEPPKIAGECNVCGEDLCLTPSGVICVAGHNGKDVPVGLSVLTGLCRCGQERYVSPDQKTWYCMKGHTGPTSLSPMYDEGSQIGGGGSC
jgi:hypothetical protein